MTLVPETLVNGSGSFGIADVVGLVVRLEHVVAAPVEDVEDDEDDTGDDARVEEDTGEDTGVEDVLGTLTGGGLELVTGVEEVVGVVGVDPPVPGRHCEYQALLYTQVEPEAQVVDPV